MGIRRVSEDLPVSDAAPSRRVSSCATTLASWGRLASLLGARDSSSSKKRTVGCPLAAWALAFSNTSRKRFSDSPACRWTTSLERKIAGYVCFNRLGAGVLILSLAHGDERVPVKAP